MSVRLDPGLMTPATSTSQPRVNANDFQQFAALRRGARADDPAALREVARQFESLFTKMMLDSMRAASFGDPLFGSDQGDMYQDMMDDQLAIEMSQGRGLGLADMLIRQLGGGQVAPAGPDPRDGMQDVTPQARQEFIDAILPEAQAAARELGVDARGIVAQAALETGWGRSQPAGESGRSNNMFGIKAGESWRGATVAANTEEYESGVAVRRAEQFRAYESAGDSVRDYVRLLRDNPRYAAALNTGSDVRAFAGALQRGGYATDPEYANKLVAVAERLPADLHARQSTAARFKPDHIQPIASMKASAS